MTQVEYLAFFHSHFLNCDFLKRPGLSTQWSEPTPAEKKMKEWLS